jgi:hypothetical protein
MELNMRKVDQTPRRGTGTRRLFSPLARAACAAGVCIALAMPAHAAKSVIDEELVRILAELETNQKEEFDKNIDRWKEVSDLLKAFIEYSKVEQERHDKWRQNNTLLEQGKRDEFKKTFADLVSGMREVKGTDLSSKALANGLAAPAAAGGAAGGVNAILAEIGKLLQAFTNGDTDDLLKMLADGTFLSKDASALAQVLAMHTSGDIDVLIKQVEAQNVGRPNATVLTQGVKDSLQRIKLRTDTYGQELTAVQTTAKGSSSRLAALETLVAQVNSLGAIDPTTGQPRFDAAKLAELRTYLTSLSALQNEELVKLNAKEMGDRATDQLMSSAGTARTLQSQIERAGK